MMTAAVRKDEEQDSDPTLTSTSTSSANGTEIAGKCKACNKEKNMYARAIMAMRLAVFIDAASLLVMGPNLPYLVTPGWHEDSFGSTGIFSFASSQYFITMTSDFGGAMGSYFFGKLSDSYGRRGPFLIALSFSTIICILRFYVQDNFVAFALMGFAHGFFSPCTALGMAYASDVMPTRHEKDQEINTVQAINMVGRTGGGVLGILLGRIDLFVPLLAVASLNFCAAILAYVFLFDPEQACFASGSTLHGSEYSDSEQGLADIEVAESDVAIHAVVEMNEKEDIVNSGNKSHDQGLIWNIMGGALADNLGSAGLVPFGLTPLMFNAFYADFVRDGEEPIMSEEGFKWIYVLVALSVIPGALLSPYLYQKIGAPVACVVANVFTGCVTVLLLYVASGSVTLTSFIAFVVILYVTFPMTVISQLSTGPMLDRVVPENKRGEIQGLNMVILSLGSAIAPFCLGNLADTFGISVAIWTAFGVSLLAGLINLPLAFAPILQVRGE